MTTETYAAYSGVKPCDCPPKGCTEWHERKQADCLRFIARTAKLEVTECATCKSGTWHKDGACMLCSKDAT